MLTFPLSSFPGKPIWLTEWAYNDQPLNITQAFFNESIAWLDNNTIIERYSYFGTFRSQVSNVGPNAAFLDAKGQLTDIGSWYLGGSATGNIPSKNSFAPRALSHPGTMTTFAVAMGTVLIGMLGMDFIC
jgi:hypothetical protein